MVRIIDTEDTKTRGGRWAAAVDADQRSADALKENPALGDPKHLAEVNDVLTEAKVFTGFDPLVDSDYTNHVNAKTPYTKVKIEIKGQRNFTPSDSTALESHLQQTFPNTVFGKFTHPKGKRRIIIHINL